MIDLGDYPKHIFDEKVNPKGTAPSGRMWRVGARDPALKRRANQIFVPSGRAVAACSRTLCGDAHKTASRPAGRAQHPTDAETRRSGLEFALPVTVGDNVWIGGGAILCPGVTIGADTVIGAGSVVTRDLPPSVIAVGNPCRVLRSG